MASEMDKSGRLERYKQKEHYKLIEKDICQYDEDKLHKATVSPGLKRAVAEDQNRGMSNQ